MKKKLSLLFILFVIICSDLLAYKVYLAPMEGSRGIPMNPFKVAGDGQTTSQNVHYSRIEGYVSKDGDIPREAKEPWAGYVNNSLGYNKYTDQEMIALGGIKDLSFYEAYYPDDPQYFASIDMSATCPGGFYLVSQSNPAYKRPFELYIIPKAKIWSTITASKSRYGTPRVLSESNYNISFSYKDLIRREDYWDSNASSSTYPHQLWFDMVLVLPGTIENDVLIRKVLEQVDGNRRKAATILDISERTLYRKIKDFGLNENGAQDELD